MAFPEKVDYVIVGAGIHGLSTAWHLASKLKASFIFVSNNFRFGNKREGNVRQLIKNEPLYKYKIIKPKPLIKNKKIISSSFIRNLLQNGKLK